MPSAWANNLPRVTVEPGHAKRVTFIYPYYLSAVFLTKQIVNWCLYDRAVQDWLSAIIVDDGSPTPAVLPDYLPFPVRLFRIQEDRPWNWLAARNIGAHHAAEGWLLLTDMDHVVPLTTAMAVIWGQHHPQVVYAFSRREHTGEVVTPHSASFLMTRQMFWRIGGYDETLSGHYGTDGDFRRRILKHAPITVLTDELIRYEHVADASTSQYARKLPADAAAVKQLVAARGPKWAPKVLSFPYEEVSC